MGRDLAAHSTHVVVVPCVEVRHTILRGKVLVSPNPNIMGIRFLLIIVSPSVVFDLGYLRDVD